MAFLDISDNSESNGAKLEKEAKVEFGSEYNEYEDKEIRIIKIYTSYDPPLIQDYKQLEWRKAQYRPERQDGKVLYWVFSEKVLDDVLAILERHHYRIPDKELTERMKLAAVETKKTFADYESDSNNLKLINEMARPGTTRWAERVLREQYNFQKLIEQNKKMDIHFNLDNSREVIVTMKDINATFKIAIPLKYPEEIPLTKLEGDWKETNFKDNAQIVYYRKVLVACLGELKKQWKPQMTIAHFIKLFAHYLAAAQYSEELPNNKAE